MAQPIQIFLGETSPEEAGAWYCEIMGGREKDGTVWLFDQPLDFIEGPGQDPESRVVIENGDDLNALIRRTAEAGSEVVEPPAEGPDGVTRAILRDVFHHTWRFEVEGPVGAPPSGETEEPETAPSGAAIGT
ncbi:VOC family protein [Paracoccaceae bacterium GXU_MW_L88]